MYNSLPAPVKVYFYHFDSLGHPSLYSCTCFEILYKATFLEYKFIDLNYKRHIFENEFKKMHPFLILKDTSFFSITKDAYLEINFKVLEDTGRYWYVLGQY